MYVQGITIIMYNFDDNSHHQFAAEEFSYKAGKIFFKFSGSKNHTGVDVIVSSDLLICLHYKCCRHK